MIGSIYTLLFAASAAPAVHGGVTRRRVRGGRVYEKFDPPEVEIEPARLDDGAPVSGQNELLWFTFREQQRALTDKATAILAEQANARALEVVAKAQSDAAKVRIEAARVVAAQIELARIAQEIEELDVAYIVALMD